MIKPYSITKELGRLGEEEIFPLLEQFLDEPITHTAKENDTLDGESESYWVELKCRQPPYKSDAPILRSGWLLPECKIVRASKESKPTYFFYYFVADDTLWYYKYNPEDFKTLTPKPFHFHPRKQTHYWVPPSLWTQIPVETVYCEED